MTFFFFLLLHIFCSTVMEVRSSALNLSDNYHFRLKQSCTVYEDAFPTLFDDILTLFKDVSYYSFVRWPEESPLQRASGSEQLLENVYGGILSKGSLKLEKTILRIQSSLVKDIGQVLDEVAHAINLTSLLKKVKATGFKLHII